MPTGVYRRNKDMMTGKIKGRIPWNKGKIGVYTEETKKKISMSHRGKIVSEKTKEKLRQINKGKHPIKDYCGKDIVIIN